MTIIDQILKELIDIETSATVLKDKARRARKKLESFHSPASRKGGGRRPKISQDVLELIIAKRTKTVIKNQNLSV